MGTGKQDGHGVFGRMSLTEDALFVVFVVIYGSDHLMATKFRLAIGVGFLVLFFARKYFRKFAGLERSGISQYHEAYDTVGNREVFGKVQKDYLYVGTSFRTCLDDFVVAQREFPRGAKARILIAGGGADNEEALRFSAGLWRGAGEPTVEEIATLRGRIQEVVARLSGVKDVEVRFHKEKLNYWAHIVDGKEMCFGLLAPGIDGLRGPVMELQERQGRYSMFEYHKQEMEALWEKNERGRNAAA